MVNSFINSKRIRDYPRLFLVASSIVLLLNFVFSNGWIGGLTGILMWGDFIDFYSAGLIYKTNIGQMYNIEFQEMTQRKLIAPSIPSGVSFFGYPPNSAQLFSIFSYISLPVSLTLWCLISIALVILVSKLIHRYLIPSWLTLKGMTSLQLSVIVFSSLAFIEGFTEGQIHTLNLLLVLLLLITTMKEKWFLAGVIASLLTYKPQFVIGFILLWFIWKKFYPILVFILFSLIWQLTVLIQKGINPFLNYLSFTNNLTYLPYIKEGFPIAIQSTPYALIASVISIKFAPIWNKVFLIIIFLIIAVFCILAFKIREFSFANKNIMLAMAISLPLVISPYGLLHDLLLLLPVFILLITNDQENKHLLYLAIGVYLSILIVPLLSIAFKIALTGTIPLITFIYIVKRSLRLVKVKSNY